MTTTESTALDRKEVETWIAELKQSIADAKSEFTTARQSASRGNSETKSDPELTAKLSALESELAEAKTVLAELRNSPTLKRERESQEEKTAREKSEREASEAAASAASAASAADLAGKEAEAKTRQGRMSRKGLQFQ